MEPRADSSFFSRVVREPLDSVVSPLVRDALVHDALTMTGLKTPPLERVALNKFITGALRTVLERALGTELGNSVTEEMLRVLSTTLPGLQRPRVNTRVPRPRTSQPPARSNAPTSTRTVPPVGARSSAPPAASARSSAPPAASARSSAPPKAVSAPPAGASSAPPPRAASAPPDSSPRSSPTSSSSPRTPVPYGMRRPTPPPGMIDARGVPPSPGGSIPPLSGERRRSRGPALPSIAVPRSGLVIIASEDRAVFDALSARFDERARVRRVLSAADVVRTLDETGAGRKLVLLDAKAPSVRPAALAILLESMPEVEVVVFRSAQSTEEAALAASVTTAKWIIYRDPASLEHVAAACLTLVS
jgi:hypothetical protein